MPTPTYAKVAVVCLLFVLMLSSSQAMALTLPAPPDKSAPANNQSGPLQGAQSFAGGVYLVNDGSSEQNMSVSEFVVEFFCITHAPFVSKQFSTSVGESISGPVSSDQASGIIAAVDSVRPPRMVNLTVNVGGLDMEGNITYVLTGVTYKLTTYSVWTTTQQSPPVEQRVGYIVVSVPIKPQIQRDFLDLNGSSCETYSLNKFGPGWNSNASSTFIHDSSSWLQNPLGSVAALPDDGVAPVLTYGPVEVLSSTGVAGAADIKPGQNVTFALPPGSYSAVDKVTVLGISFDVTCGTYSSSSGSAAAQFTVTLAGVENVWHGLEATAVLIVIAVIILIFWRFKLWPHVARGYKKASRKVHEWIDERLRASRGLDSESPLLWWAGQSRTSSPSRNPR